MQKKIERKTHIIDATNKSAGRLATKISILLRGKHKPDFAPNKDIGDYIVVKNAGKMKFTGKKLEKKIYYHHTGYLGHLKEIPMAKIFENDPSKILRMAVMGMLPKTRLKSNQIKRLKIEK